MPAFASPLLPSLVSHSCMQHKLRTDLRCRMVHICLQGKQAGGGAIGEAGSGWVRLGAGKQAGEGRRWVPDGTGKQAGEGADGLELYRANKQGADTDYVGLGTGRQAGEGLVGQIWVQASMQGGGLLIKVGCRQSCKGEV